MSEMLQEQPLNINNAAEKLGFNIYGSQQFATVVFDRSEDQEYSEVTVFYLGKINQFNCSNELNPSRRRWATAVYAHEERDRCNVVKFCTIRRKGETLQEIHPVTTVKELAVLFPGYVDKSREDILGIQWDAGLFGASKSEDWNEPF